MSQFAGSHLRSFAVSPPYSATLQLCNRDCVLQHCATFLRHVLPLRVWRIVTRVCRVCGHMCGHACLAIWRSACGHRYTCMHGSARMHCRMHDC